jgi:signal transduction histidine kinase
VHSVVLPVEAGAVVLSIRDLGVAGAFEVTDHFLAVLAHALRTPLNAMVGWLHVLKGGSNVPEATAHRAIEGISRALDQQQRLVEDMRDMAHILTGTVVVELHPVELWTSIETVVAEINPQATAKGVRLRVEHRAGRRAVADPPRLQQAVHHLLANAVKYTPRGGEVLVATAEAGDHVEIRVSDSGEPISPDLLPLIFERFGQGDLTVTRGDDGFGLALVKKLIELQGGEAVAQGTGRSTGAHFVLRLPAAQASQAAAGEAGSN